MQCYLKSNLDKFHTHDSFNLTPAPNTVSWGKLLVMVFAAPHLDK